jgi:hypothetical protein
MMMSEEQRGRFMSPPLLKKQQNLPSIRHQE